jgi:hypothetical protein
MTREAKAGDKCLILPPRQNSQTNLKVYAGTICDVLRNPEAKFCIPCMKWHRYCVCQLHDGFVADVNVEIFLPLDDPDKEIKTEQKKAQPA